MFIFKRNVHAFIRPFLFLLLILAVGMVAWSEVGHVTAAATYYVATNGNDSWSGTLAAPNGSSTDGPFRTIQRCATVAVAGNICAIRAGTYRETVKPANSGTSGTPIVFQPYNNENVVINGADVVTGWTAHDLSNGRSIYKAAQPWTFNSRSTSPIVQISNDQVFVNGSMLPEAQYPNIPVSEVTHPKASLYMRATGASGVSKYSATLISPQMNVYPVNYWVGGKINFTPGSQIFWTTCDITASTSSSVSFTCNTDFWNQRSELDGTWTVPQEGTYFFLWGKQGGLDAPGEWFRAPDGTLYLWTADGADPAGRTVEARRRAFGLDFSGRSYITVQGIKLFAAGINTNAVSQRIIIDDIEARYLWHVQQLPPIGQNAGTSGIRFDGSNLTLSNSLLAFSAGAAVKQGESIYGPKTSGNQIVNNVIYDMSYHGFSSGITGGIEGNNGIGSDFHLVRSNTLWNSGNIWISISSGVNIVNNDAYQSHLLLSDLATIYNWNTNGLGAEVAYNYVHDNYAEVNTPQLKYGGHGIYLDDNSYNTAIHHNITWQTTSPGIFVFGQEVPISGWRRIYNNTVDGTLSAAAKTSGGFNQTLTNTEVRNNIAIRLGLSDPNLTVSNNLSGEGGWLNRAGRDYGLRNDSLLLDRAMVLPPYTDGYTGAAPDIGALEYGTVPFVAGAVIRERDLTGLNANCEPGFGAPTATCTVTGLPMGRKLPNIFQIRIGTASAAQNCVTPMNYTTNYGIGLCRGVSTNGLSGVQPISIRLGGGWVTVPNTVDVGGLQIFSVSPTFGPKTGGTTLTITGRRFDYANGAAYRVPITLSNTTGVAIGAYQVAVTFNSAALISAGKMRPDCGDLRFSDSYGQLSYWIEEGCNTTATRVWVKVLAIANGGTAISMTYGNPSLTSASSGSDTFLWFPDLSTGTLNSAIQLDTPSGVSVTQGGGQIRVAGSTNSSNQYNSFGFIVQTWELSLPTNWAIDSEMTIVNGSNNFKAGVGAGGLNLYGSTYPKNIGYWNGSAWVQLGTSTVNTATLTSKKFSMGYARNDPYITLRWFENGSSTPRIARDLTQSGAGHFNYSPDTISSFDVRFAKLRIRHFVYPEPASTVGAETVVSTRFSIGGLACRNVIVTSYTTATCTTPSHAPGRVMVGAVNPDGGTFNFDGFTYTNSFGVDTPGLYNAANAFWLLRNSNSTGAPTWSFPYGPANNPNLVPLTGDWNGDGTDTVGLYVKNTSVWLLSNDNQSVAYSFPYGTAGQNLIPVVGDWDGNDTDTIGLYNPANGAWILSNQNASVAPTLVYPYGGFSGAVPIPGDWNGDGIDTPGVWNPANGAWILANVHNSAPFASFPYGSSALKPVKGDYDGDGSDTPGLWNPANGAWLLINQNASIAPQVTYVYGAGSPSLIPLMGKWTIGGSAGDRLPDPATPTPEPQIAPTFAP